MAYGNFVLYIRSEDEAMWDRVRRQAEQRHIPVSTLVRRALATYLNE